MSDLLGRVIMEIKYECPKDANHNIFNTKGSTSTLLAYHIVYDRYGRPLTANPNTINEAFECRVCGEIGIKETEGWKVTFKDAETREVYLEQDLTPDYIKEGS